MTKNEIANIYANYLYNDTSFTEMLYDKEIILSTDSLLDNLIQVFGNFYDNNDHIKETSLENLLDASYLLLSTQSIFNVRIDLEVMKRLFYCYKYLPYNSFFKDNYRYFLSEEDYDCITTNIRMKIFFESLMTYFDEFCQKAKDIYYCHDLNECDDYFIPYIADMFGFKKEESEILTDFKFRELLKNIMYFYKCKGTERAARFFFNILGFDIELYDTWFDKRCYYLTTNDFTNCSDKSDFQFYLVHKRRLDDVTLFSGISLTTELYGISYRDITTSYNLYDFADLVSSNSVEKVLGLASGYSGNKYEYFKTNLVYIDIAPMDGSLWTEEKRESIKKYLEKVMPVNIDYEDYVSFVSTISR